MSVEEILSETGDEVTALVREELPAKKPDEKAEDTWAEALTGNADYNAAFIGEEGTYTVEEDPHYAFLVDPLDGTSGAVNGEFPWVTTTVTVLDGVDVNGNRVTGSPVGCYIRQIDGNGAEFSSWDGEASIDGEVRFTELDSEDDLPGTVAGTEIGPRTVESFEDLASDRKGLVSAYAAKKGRRPVRKNFHESLEELSDSVRVGLTGGSYTCASVGWGKTLVAGEPKPTLPTEAAGEVFAEAMGSEASDIYGEENDTITVKVGEDGPERTYTAVVAANEEILDETLEAVDVKGLEEAYVDEFRTYNEKR
jgi:fructose-1,6-bisphosphatase/inositol monophosphatase family enzyme